VQSRRQTLILLPSVLLLLFSLPACASAGPSSGRLALPCQPTISDAAADRMEEKLRPVLEPKGPTVFTVQATNDEMTSFLSRALLEHGGASPLEGPRVCFSAGEVHMSGRFTNVTPFQFTAVVVAVPRPVDGRLVVEVKHASVGSLRLPGALLRRVSTTVNETLAELELGVQFRAIEIGEGQIIVSGERHQT
jgi:hypothetical protein